MTSEGIGIQADCSTIAANTANQAVPVERPSSKPVSFATMQPVYGRLSPNRYARTPSNQCGALDAGTLTDKKN